MWVWMPTIKASSGAQLQNSHDKKIIGLNMSTIAHDSRMTMSITLVLFSTDNPNFTYPLHKMSNYGNRNRDYTR